MTDHDIRRSLQEAKRLLLEVSDEIHRRAWDRPRPTLADRLRKAVDAINGCQILPIPTETPQISIDEWRATLARLRQEFDEAQGPDSMRAWEKLAAAKHAAASQYAELDPNS